MSSSVPLLLDCEIEEMVRSPRQVQNMYHLESHKMVVKAVNIALTQKAIMARPRMSNDEHKELNVDYLYWKTKSLLKLQRWAPYASCWRFIDKEYRAYISLELQREAHSAIQEMASFKHDKKKEYYGPDYELSEFPDPASAQLFFEERAEYRQCHCCLLM